MAGERQQYQAFDAELGSDLGGQIGQRKASKSASSHEAQGDVSSKNPLDDTPQLKVAEEIDHISAIEDDFDNPMSLAALANSLSR